MIRQLVTPLASSIVRTAANSWFIDQAAIIAKLGMKLGMNAAWINSWANAWVFSNLMYHVTKPERTSGTGPWTHVQGVITASAPTDTFRLLLSDKANKLPAGVYTVLNPDGLKVFLGGWNTPQQDSFTTATQFSYTHLADSPTALCMHVLGSLTANTGKLAVILPGHLTSWLSGNVWNEQFLEFYRGLKLPLLRAMDWTWASQNLETEWADRSTTAGVTLTTPWANGACVPYELICDIAGRLDIDVWVCSPVRASANYIQQMASLFNAHLPAGRRVWLEHGNEVWNSGVPWGDGTAWVAKRDYTRRTAIADSVTQKLILTNHGLSNGDRITCYTTPENRLSTVPSTWQFGLGCNVYIKVLDQNTFEAYETASLTTKIVITDGTKNVLFTLDGEPGKTDNLNGNYGDTCLRNWGIFDSVMGESRVVRILAAHLDNPTTTTGRLASPGVRDRASAVAVAPYYDGSWFGGLVACSDGTLTPKFWASASNQVHIAVYPSGSSPSADDVISGVGSISKQVVSYSTSSSYSTFPAINGLVNGVSYLVCFVYVDTAGSWLVSAPATPSATPGVALVLDSYSNQALRNRLGIAKSMLTFSSHVAIANGIDVLCYEGGLHFHQAAPDEVKGWLAGYQESAEFGDVTRRYLTELASAGSKALCYYGDSLATTFSIANGFTDTSDIRYLEFKRRGGIAEIAKPPVFKLAAGNIVTKPVYPHAVHDLGEPSYSYDIISGNKAGNYSVVNGVLTLVSGYGIQWGVPTLVNLVIIASNDGFTRKIAVSFATGNAWYDIDSSFVWDSKTSADNTKITPVIGGVIPLVEGVGAVITDGMWAMANSNRYYSATGVVADIQLDKSAMWAAVLNLSGQTGYYKNLWRQGAGNFISTTSMSATSLELVSNIGGSSVPALKFAPAFPIGPHVFWLYYDSSVGKVYAGYDQVVNGSVLVAFSGVLNRRLSIGGSTDTAGMTSGAKHGSMQILSRGGLSLADTLAMVARMQSYHGIA